MPILTELLTDPKWNAFLPPSRSDLYQHRQIITQNKLYHYKLNNKINIAEMPMVRAYVSATFLVVFLGITDEVFIC